MTAKNEAYSLPSEPMLFQPITLGHITLSHRIALAPMMRCRANANHVPLAITIEYFAQRASTPGTLLITDACIIHPKVGGYAHAPGIYTDEQITAWKRVVDAVHARGSYIVLQLWALGRAASPQVLAAEGGYDYVAASAIPLSSSLNTPRALRIEKIQEIPKMFATAARNAVYKAGFDGVEIHGANGYLLDGFLQDVTNVREDEYGGSVENRCRLTLEVVEAVAAAVGQERTALRCSAFSSYLEMGMKNPYPTFTYLVTRLKDHYPDLMYLHFTEPHMDGTDDAHTPFTEDVGSANDFVRRVWAPRPFLSAGGYTRETALYVTQKYGDVIAFGRYFISNPDLVYRLREGLPCSGYNRDTFYTPESGQGYIDYASTRP
ncbi:FMN-linked oxidoreductase [Dentipellis sp. KUC8613]|nr:FMN-linked oxidoreductase [Dentipellis sp. KUC8613]